jgi:Ring finger domain
MLLPEWFNLSWREVAAVCNCHCVDCSLLFGQATCSQLMPFAVSDRGQELTASFPVHYVLSMQEGDHMVLLLCRHHLHLNCASGWLQQHATCPICRADLVRLAADFKHQHHQHLRHAQHHLQPHDQQQQQHQMTSLQNLQDAVVAAERNIDGSDKPHNASVREMGTFRPAL